MPGQPILPDQTEGAGRNDLPEDAYLLPAPTVAMGTALGTDLEPSNGQLTFGSAGWFAYRPATDFHGMDSFTYKVFDGIAWSDPANVLIEVLAELQIPGDATGDGLVNEADSARLASNWGESGVDWSKGDFDGDGVVGPNDASILAANWGYGTEQSGESSAVPEPGMMVLLLGGLAGLLGFRRRK